MSIKNKGLATDSVSLVRRDNVEAVEYCSGHGLGGWFALSLHWHKQCGTQNWYDYTSGIPFKDHVMYVWLAHLYRNLLNEIFRCLLPGT